MTILAVAVIAGVLTVGTTGMVKGGKWFWHHSGCVVKNGIKACKGK